ncbi:MAG: hypothetical protein U0T73_05305 [Chitinophagales bacterium]
MKKLGIFALLLVLVSCKKEKALPPERLVFGQFYGECAGERCIEIYKIENRKLFEDRNDQYPSFTAFYSANYDMLSTAQYESVKNLKNMFPMALLNESRTVIGAPDAGDWGGYYIEYEKGDMHQFWLIDKMRGSVPSAYHPFLDSVEAKILLLK